MEPTTSDHTVFPPNGSVNTTGSTGTTMNSTLGNARNTVVNSEVDTSAAYDAVANHPLTQNVKDTVANGPVAENAKEQAIKTQNEFSNLAAARTTPSQPAATGQPLTHYHSFFSSLLSWENPRASAIAFASVILLIFGARYLDLLRYAFKLTWMVLGVTVLAEIAGKTLLSRGLTSSLRPRKYYVMPRETIDSMIGDVHELINFFVIETQRIVFAENVYTSLAAFVGAFISYYLYRIVPFWGLCLIGTSVMFLVPLIYISNQELIDHHVRKASNVVNAQTEQVKQLASHHANVAAETTKQMASDYTAKAQEMVGAASAKVSSATSSATSAVTPATKPIPTQSTILDHTAFPSAPKDDFKTTTVPTVGSTASTLRDENEPLIVA